MTSIILNRVKYPHNLAGAIRAAACFGVDTVYWTGDRFQFEAGERLPREERMRGYRSVKFEQTERPFDLLPAGTVPVCVELLPSAAPLTYYRHPKNAAYVFGPEDGNVSQSFRGLCHQFVYIPAYHCLNLVAAMNVVLAHRMIQVQLDGLESICEVGAMLKEQRGPALMETLPGWDGK